MARPSSRRPRTQTSVVVAAKRLVVLSSVVDLLIIGTLALSGTSMAPLAPSIAAGILAAAVLLALVMDQVKVWLFAYFKMI